MEFSSFSDPAQLSRVDSTVPAKNLHALNTDEKFIEI
jgi:hypothetical protein